MSLRRKNNAEIARRRALLNAPMNQPPSPLKEESKRGHGRRPIKTWIKATIGAAAVVPIAIYGNDIADWIFKDPPPEEWSITNKPNGDPVIPNRQVAPKDPNAPMNLRLNVGQKASVIVCEGYVFVDKTKGIEIHNPVVDGLPSDRDGALYPRSVKVASNNGSIEIGPASKPTDYKWILGNGAVTMTVPSMDCAEHQVKADQYPNGPHQNDTLRLHDPGYETYPDVPVTGYREGLVHFTAPHHE